MLMLSIIILGGFKMENLNIRQKIKEAGLKQWEVAEAYGISEGNFSRLMRRELSPERRQRVLDAIERLKEGEQA